MPRSLPRWGWQACVVAGALALTACAEPPAIDLTAGFAGAERLAERRRIDFGVAETRPLLHAGWSADGRFFEDTIVWGLETESRLDLIVVVPRPITLRMRCWPLPFPGLPEQSVQLVLNGTPVGHVALRRTPDEYAVPIPPAALRPGRNELVLRYAYARRPADLDPASDDRRNLAVAWDWIELDGVEDAELPAIRDDGDGRRGVLMPPASEVVFYAQIPPGSTLAVEAEPLSRGAARASPQLAIAAQFEDGAEAGLAIAVGEATRRTWPLPRPGVARIAMRNTTAASNGTPGQAILVTALRLQHAAPERRPPSCAAARALRGGNATPPPIIVYLIDTLRADHLGCYGYGRPTSPRIDAFARQAVRFERALANAPWTKPAVASIFTGLTPPQHGTIRKYARLGTMPTMASLLAAQGYETAAFLTNGFAGEKFGLMQGFAEHRLLLEEPIAPDEPVTAGPDEMNLQRAEVLHRVVFEWLDRRTAQAPLFLYVHASDPHTPYLPPAPFRRRFAPDADPQLGLISRIQPRDGRPLPPAERAQMIDLYDAEIAYADDQFGAFLDGLRARGLYDDALVVLVADHGEAFDEHGRLLHGWSLYEEEVAIPLIIKLPGHRAGGTVVTGVAQQIDLLPTLLDLVGATSPTPLTGTSLLDAAACGQPLPAGRAAYLHVHHGKTDAIEGVVVGPRKLIYDDGRSLQMLFDLDRDPAERQNRADAAPLQVGYLRSLAPPLKAPVGELAPVPDAEVDPAMQERLRALGYQP